MSIRDVSGLPDDRVPDWVRRRREEQRAAQLLFCSCMRHFANRVQVLDHCDATGHTPLVAHDLDPFLKRGTS